MTRRIEFRSVPHSVSPCEQNIDVLKQCWYCRWAKLDYSHAHKITLSENLWCAAVKLQIKLQNTNLIQIIRLREAPVIWNKKTEVVDPPLIDSISQKYGRAESLELFYWLTPNSVRKIILTSLNQSKKIRHSNAKAFKEKQGLVSRSC